jgi:hypothetical protein
MQHVIYCSLRAGNGAVHHWPDMGPLQQRKIICPGGLSGQICQSDNAGCKLMRLGQYSKEFSLNKKVLSHYEVTGTGKWYAVEQKEKLAATRPQGPYCQVEILS